MRVARQRIEARDCVDFIAEELEPDRFFIGGGGINFHHVAAILMQAQKKPAKYPHAAKQKVT